MNQVILYRQGAYQLYDKGLRVPVFTAALTLIEVVNQLREERGAKVFKDLHVELDQAYATGCSDGKDLYTTILSNNKGLSPSQFVERYLTL